MSFYPIIVIACIAFYGAYYFYIRRRNSQQVQQVNNTDFKAEFVKAGQYKTNILNSSLSFLKEAMGQEKIDGLNYAGTEHNTANIVKDAFKDKMKEMATLGTVRFNTVYTAKYLILSGDNLHLLDTDTEGEIDKHFVFKRERLEKATIAEHPLEGQVRAQIQARGNHIKAYKLSLPTDQKPVDLVIYSCLIFNNISETPVNPQETIQDIVIASDFLKQLGEKYPNLKVALPIFS